MEVRSGDVVINQRSDIFVDVDKLPFPSYSKLPMQKYRSALGAARRSPSIGMITSRGCPGQCTFCFFRDVRFKNQVHVARESS